ncbi:MAG: NYN domain-containing protein [Oscillospiraceae bacterium]|nr:NYN domain-containing protein [Oscillospiraceae bacterium]
MVRTAIFIDEGYWMKVLDGFGRPKIDYSKFSTFLARGESILRVYYYTALPYRGKIPTKEEQTRYEKKQGFLNSLSRLDFYEVRCGKLKRMFDENGKSVFQQKRVDTLMTCDLLRLTYKARMDRAVIVTGDSDFIPAIQITKDEGVQIELVYGGDKYLPSNDLLLLADTRRELTQDDLDVFKLV